MATLDTTGVVATMFQDDTTLTIGGETYNLPANQPIGIPDGVNSVTSSATTKALCQTQSMAVRKIPGSVSVNMPVLFANEIRVVS